MSYKNILLNFNVNEIYCITSTFNNTNYSFVLPVNLNRSYSNIVDRIQVVSQSNRSFNRTFSNQLGTETLNYKNYISSARHADMFIDNDIIKDVFIDYNQQAHFGNDSNLVDYVEFDNSNFTIQDIDDAESFVNINKYEILLPLSFSRALVEKNYSNIKLIFLSADDEVLYESEVTNVLFNNVKENDTRNEPERLYTNLILDNFSEGIEISYNFSGHSSPLVSVNVPILVSGAGVLHEIAITNDLNNYSQEFTGSGSWHQASYFLFSTYKEFEKSSKDKFEIHVNVECKINLSESTPASYSFVKIFQYNRTSELYDELKNLYSRRISIDILHDLDFRQRYVASNESATFVEQICVISDTTPELLDRIKILKITKNNITVEKIYLNTSGDIESEFNYQGKSISEYLNTSSKYFIKSYDSSAIFTIELEFMGTKKTFNSNSIVKRHINKINIVNSIFKECISINNVLFNTTLTNNTKSIYEYEDIQLTNLNLLNEIAYSYGYINSENKGDASSFLRSSMIMFDNRTEVKSSNKIFNNNSSEFDFISNVFNNSSIKEKSLRSILTPDFDSLHKSSSGAIESLYVQRFFMSDSIEDSYNLFSNIASISASNNLDIKILPIPKIISLCRGLGISHGVPITDEYTKSALERTGYSDINNLRRDLMVKLVEFIQEISISINYDTYHAFIDLWLDASSSNDISRFYRYFNIFAGHAISDNFKLTTIHNKENILNTSTFLTNKEYMLQRLITSRLEFGLTNKVCNVGFSDDEVQITTLPIKAAFSFTTYNEELDSYSFRNIAMINNASENLVISLEGIKDLISISDIIKDTIRIRLSLHFLALIEDTSLISNTRDFASSTYKNKNVLTYTHHYANKKINNIKTHVPLRHIELNIPDKSIVMSISGQDFDINKLKYSDISSFFEFARSKNANKLEKIILRTSLSFKVKSSGKDEKCVTCFFNTDIPYINLNDKNIKIDLIESITSIQN